jgi:hypothetical protein
MSRRKGSGRQIEDRVESISNVVEREVEKVRDAKSMEN